MPAEAIPPSSIGDVAKSVLALKYAAHDWGAEHSPATQEALCEAADVYFKALSGYKSNREG